MTLTATYDPVLSRVRLDADLLGASATYAVIDRTTNNGITYTTVRGGSEVEVTSQEISGLDDYEFPANIPVTYRIRSYDVSDALQTTQTTSITATLTSPWLKFIARPYLNREITLMGAGPIERSTRTGVFEVIGRSTPVAVTDLHSSRRVTISVKTETEAQARDLDLALSNGLPVYLHTPEGFFVPTMYAVVGDYGQEAVVPVTPFTTRRFNIPLIETAAPAADVVGSAGTWAILQSSYATWDQVIDDFATWNDVAELIGDPSDIIVG
jgi:hypothetical protein